MENDFDIYFKTCYAKLSVDEGQELVEYDYFSNIGKVKYLFIKRKITTNLYEDVYDITSPYGYGGPFFYNYQEGNMNELKAAFFKEFYQYCITNRIISEFVRFHPLYENQNLYEIFNFQAGHTVYINLVDEATILSEMDGKARNMIRKAKNNGLKVENDESLASSSEFIKIYRNTMEKNNACKSYYFSENYFKKMFSLEETKLFNVYLGNELLAATTILVGKEFIHYHLSANTEKGYKLAANNLLLFEIAKWGATLGYKKFHLGGGYGGDDSPLFKFKRSMAKNNVCGRYFGKRVFDEDVYSNLIQEALNSNRISVDSNYFPKYRKED